MRFFLAGIMQGSHLGAELHNQNYREQLKVLLLQYFPGSDVYDPLADHRESLDYDDTTGRGVFYRHNRMCREVDVVLAFVPEASMGTAIEMWEAHEHGRGIVITISPLTHNWAIKYCSHAVFPDVAALQSELESGRLAEHIAKLLAAKRQQVRESALDNGKPTPRPHIETVFP
jgi:hypothetical protein